MLKGEEFVPMTLKRPGVIRSENPTFGNFEKNEDFNSEQINPEWITLRAPATEWMLFFSSAVYAQNVRTVKGQVVDSKKESVIGASVRFKEDASVGTVTDIDGNFSINVSGNNQTLVVSYLGMTTQEVSIGKTATRLF